MRYRIERQDEEVDIEVADIGGKEVDLLAAFEACQAGRCGCPTSEYEKLDSLEVYPVRTGVRLHLRPKTGERLDAQEIERCMEYTLRQIERAR
ncbi:MAG: hypothetical protein GWO02_04865 [Gammaproteobacteria bacterium]|nr:hypothetical protein [Gammaproteobacteria bacterium]